MQEVSPYRAFAMWWHMSRGDYRAVARIEALPPEVFVEIDRLLIAAYLAGAAEAAEKAGCRRKRVALRARMKDSDSA